MVGALALALPTAGRGEELTTSTLSITIGALPPLVVEQAIDPFNFFQTSGLDYTIASGAFAWQESWADELFTGVPLIDGLGMDATLSEGTFTGEGGINGSFGGRQPVSGRLVVPILGGLLTPTFDLSVVGNGGVVQGGAASLMLTVTGHLWTSGFARVTGITTETPGGASVNTVTILGNDTRTTGHTGGLTLVTPVRILTSVDGNWPAFLVQQLNIVHVPEPSGLLLLGGVCGGLLVLGASKTRRR